LTKLGFKGRRFCRIAMVRTCILNIAPTERVIWQHDGRHIPTDWGF
jgi:hypothetical protein